MSKVEKNDLSVPLLRSESTWSQETDQEIPNVFLCPINKTLMENPVIVFGSGQTYEKSAIERWFKEGNTKDPLTVEALTSSGRQLVPNQILKSMISQFCTDNKISLPTSTTTTSPSETKHSIPSVTQSILMLQNTSPTPPPPTERMVEVETFTRQSRVVVTPAARRIYDNYMDFFGFWLRTFCCDTSSGSTDCCTRGLELAVWCCSIPCLATLAVPTCCCWTTSNICCSLFSPSPCENRIYSVEVSRRFQVPESKANQPGFRRVNNSE